MCHFVKQYHMVFMKLLIRLGLFTPLSGLWVP